MKNSVAVLFGFLDRCEAEVQGHALEAPSEDTLARLRDFAHGKLPAPDRLDLLRGLNQNPQWVQWLANEIRSLRSQPVVSAKRAP